MTLSENNNTTDDEEAYMQYLRLRTDESESIGEREDMEVADTEQVAN